MSSSCSRLCSVVNTGSLTRSGAERTRRRLKLGLDCPCASALWTDNYRNRPPTRPRTVLRRPARRLVERAERPRAIPPRSRRTGTGQPQVTATKRAPSTAQPVLPHRSHATPTAHERSDRRAPSTSRRLPPSCFPSADAIAIAASADVRALAAPHARHNRSVATPLCALRTCPAKGPKPLRLGWPDRFTWRVEEGGPVRQLGTPFLESPGTERKNRPQAGSGLLFSGRTTARKQQVRTTGNGFSTCAPSPAAWPAFLLIGVTVMAVSARPF
jgi:hypothetical protein